MTLNRPLVLLVLGASLLAAIGGLWLVLQSGEPKRPLETSSRESAPQPEPDHGQAPAGLAPLERPPVRSEDAERAAVDAPASATVTENFALDAAIWIEGRLLMPAGSPADESMQVLAVASDSAGEAESELRPSHGAHWLRKLAASEGGDRVAKRSVAADGTFRVPFPQGAHVGFLVLDARYLVLEKPQRLNFDLGERGPVELEVLLGAWVTGGLALPASAPPQLREAAALEVEAELGGWRMGRGSNFRMTSRLTPELEFEFRGVPVEYSLFFTVDPKVCVPALEMGWEAKAGEHLDKRIELELGAGIQGRVLDPSGKPLARARVEAEGERGMGWMMARRNAQSGDDGRFALLGVRPDKVTLTAELEGWVAATRAVEGLREGETREGVELVLESGNHVAGFVRWPDGKPAVGAQVNVAAKRGGRGAWRESLSRGKTGDDGSFRVSGLAEGPFLVRAVASRAGPTPEDPSDAGALLDSVGVAGQTAPGAEHDKDPSAPLWKARLRNVAAGTNDLELVLAEPLAVRGRVVDDVGAPVSRFHVAATTEDLGEGYEETVSGLFEADDGTFALIGFSPGAWSVNAKADDHDPGEGVHVQVPSEGTVVIALTRAGRIAGTVVDPAGQGVAGASVSARLGTSGRNRWESREATTGKDGSFEITDVPASSSNVVATADDFAPSAASVVEVAPGERVAGIVLALTQGGRLEGEIYTSAGAPDPGRGIMAQNFAAAGRGGGSGESDAAGRFVIEHLAPGPYQVMAMPSPRQLSRLSEGDQAEIMNQLKMTSVEIVEGETTHVVLGGSPKSPVRVFGRVTSAGKPLAKGVVMATREGGSMLSSLKMDQTDEDGRYKFVLDQPGDYTLIASRQMGGDDGAEFQETIPEQAEIEIDLALPLGSISGTVLDTEGHPRANVRVSAQQEQAALGLLGLSGGRDSRTDEQGHFRFDGLKPGTYTLRARAEGLGALVRSGVAVTADKATEGIDLRLPAKSTLTGTVVDALGKPVGGASIFVRDAQGRALALVSDCMSDAGGKFTYDDLPAGTVTASARLQKLCCRESSPIDLPEGGKAHVQLTLEEGTILRVTLVDEEGHALRATVSVLDDRGREWSSLYGREGMEQLMTQGFSSTEQRIGPLAPGKYKVVATTSDGRTVSKPVTLGGQDERTLKLTFKD
jgi:carboxypeptidase family protein